MKKLKNINCVILGACILLLVGCRGWKSDDPPIHPNINFDFQPKIKAQRNPLPIPENTVQFNSPRTNSRLSEYVIDEAFLLNGQKNYVIYCSACHTKTGNGTKSIVSQNGWIASNILEDVTYNKSDSAIYDIIQNGIRTMPGYGKKLNTEEIWQVVLYVRALQKMSRTTLKERQIVNRGNKQ
ncbi:MAG: c-type cytochrome [Candidatus Marinamargulisbacteria bacterium]